MKRLIGLLSVALFAALLASAGIADAQDTVHITTLAADAAPHIVNGRVLSTIDVEIDGEPHRVSEIEVSSTVKGSTAQTILVEVPGGQRADGTTVFVSHTPDFVPDSLVQVGLIETPGFTGFNLSAAVQPGLTTYSVVGGTDGAYGLLLDGVSRAQAVGDYALTGVSWADFSPAVNFYVNPAGSGISSDATANATKRGFQMWEDDLNSNVDFTYGGKTTKTGINLSDNQSVVSWVTPPSGTGWLAQASWSASSNGDIIGFDVRVNRNFNWADGAVSGRWDIGTTVGHEVGHGLGFNHAPSSSEVMYFQIVSGQANGLGPGDRSGLSVLYPAPYNGPVCNGEPVTVNLGTGQGSPTEGRDVILGTAGSDWIWAGGGDDVICGGLGVDRIFAGLGNDLVFGDGGSDHIYGQGGSDEIHGGSGADKIYGGTGSDRIWGNGGQDSIWGEDGNDEIQGNWESDKIWGGPGNDVLRGAGGKDKLYGEQGNDSLFGGLNTDYLNGGSGTDTGNGQRGADKPLIAGVSGCEQLAIASSC